MMRFWQEICSKLPKIMKFGDYLHILFFTKKILLKRIFFGWIHSEIVCLNEHMHNNTFPNNIWLSRPKKAEYAKILYIDESKRKNFTSFHIKT